MTTLAASSKLLTCGFALSLLASAACSSPAPSTATSSSTAASATPAPRSSTPPPASNASEAKPPSAPASNEDLDFTLVNKTGYSIKAIYVGASGTGDWAKEDELLKGREFTNGTQIPIKFNPKETATKWDLKVTWSDTSGSEEWLNIDLTKIDKLTLVYDKDKDVTSAIIN